MANYNQFSRVSLWAVMAVGLGVTGQSFAANSQTKTQPCLDQFYQQVAPQLQNEKLKANSTALCLNGFNALHSGTSKTSLWVAEALTPQRLSVKLKREDTFHEEQQVDDGQRATLADYRGSGYDRGHMAPNADMPTKASQNDSFSLANMVPQTAQNNQQGWRELEEGVRAIVTKQQQDVYVVTGPEYAGKNLKAIGAGKVLVPTSTYKAIYVPATGVIGAYYVSNDMKVEKPAVERISICALEQKIGINLFPTLTEQEKRKLYDLPLKASQVKANQTIKLLSTDTKSTCAAAVSSAEMTQSKKQFKPMQDYQGTMADVLGKAAANVNQDPTVQPPAPNNPAPEAEPQSTSGWLVFLRELLNFLVQLLK